MIIMLKLTWFYCTFLIFITIISRLPVSGYKEKVIMDYETLKSEIYKLNEDEKTASVIENNSNLDNIFIPRFVIYKEQKYVVTTICTKSFKNSENFIIISL